MPQALIVFLSSVAYALAGSVLLWIGYRLFDRLTPATHTRRFSRRQPRRGNSRRAFILGLAIIIAAAIHG
jgi:hypothetical protein